MYKTAAAVVIAGLVTCPVQSAVAAQDHATQASSPAIHASIPHPAINYRFLQRKIIYGQATLAQVRQALTNKDTGEITNTLHALYSMRWHRGVIHLLYDMWDLKKEKYPELSWDILNKAPARIALASTICRIQITGTEKYLQYIRSYQNDKNEFNRAQVVIALGLNGNVADVDYIKKMADGDNVYVAQSAITGLSLMGHKKASDAMIDLWFKYRGTSRGNLIQELLRQAYNLTPHERKVNEDTKKD
jgi:hypothetical protein